MGPPPQDFAPNKIGFRLVFRPKLAQTDTIFFDSPDFVGTLLQSNWMKTENMKLLLNVLHLTICFMLIDVI